MTKEEESKARKREEQAADRERMIRILKRHQKPAPRKKATPESMKEPAVLPAERQLGTDEPWVSGLH
jgi:hypothetical protein